MPHEATVEHTEALGDEVVVGAHIRVRETWSKNALGNENQRQVANIRPPTPEKGNHNFDDDASSSSDEGSSDQLIVNSGQHQINGAF